MADQTNSFQKVQKVRKWLEEQNKKNSFSTNEKFKEVWVGLQLLQYFNQQEISIFSYTNCRYSIIIEFN